jgi:hypothetical protein
MTADNNSTEDKPDPTPFKVYPMTNEARSKRMRGGPTREFASKEQAIDSQAAEPRSPRPISGKDIRTVAKVGRDEWL